METKRKGHIVCLNFDNLSVFFRECCIRIIDRRDKSSEGDRDELYREGNKSI